jgi:hypothetical protein
MFKIWSSAMWLVPVYETIHEKLKSLEEIFTCVKNFVLKESAKFWVDDYFTGYNITASTGVVI